MMWFTNKTEEAMQSEFDALSEAAAIVRMGSFDLLKWKLGT